MNATPQQPPIVALATPWGQSAIAIVRISGRDCIEKFAKIFSPSQKLREAAANSLTVGTIYNPQDGLRIDHVVVALYRSPHSYTGEDALEINCHGSPVGIRKILALCYAHGFRAAAAGEFTHRALLAGKMDLTQAEAVQEIIEARSMQAHNQAFHRLAGALSTQIIQVVEHIKNLVAAINIQLDYPEEESGDIHFDREALATSIDKLAEIEGSYQYGWLSQEGLTMVLTGAVNAGKSSLFNLLLGEERALVAESPGTTRDYLEGQLEIAGIPIRLYDTAGLRTNSLGVEEEGIRRGIELARNAHIRLHVIDIVAMGDTHHSEQILEQLAGESNNENERALLLTLYNKIDCATAKQLQSIPDGALPISATHGQGLKQLMEKLQLLIERQWGGASGGAAKPGRALVAPIISDRQYALVKRALEALRRAAQERERALSADMLTLDLQEALQALGEITGEITTEQILDIMFSRFCVGK